MISRSCRKLALVGLGGVGKTQVALELAYTVKKSWPGYSIFWVPAISVESFEPAYREIAIRCSIVLDSKEEDPKESVRQYLNSDQAGKWLLIIDNADEEEILFGRPGEQTALTDFLPLNENGIILFTTRYRKIAASLAGNEVMDIQEMNR